MQWIKVFSCSLDDDLSEFALILRQRRVPHRISEEADTQVLFAPNAQAAEVLNSLYQHWQAGVLQPARPRFNALVRRAQTGWLRHSFVTIAMLVLSVLGFGVVELDPRGEYWHWLTFLDFDLVGNQVAWVLDGGLWQGELWRIFTPMFLHFGLPHILFNGLWLWELGRRIEYWHGHTVLFTMIMGIAFISNVGQFMWVPGQIFGGMSGVIYGLLGYCWIWNMLRPVEAIPMPPGVLGFMLVWLVVCMTGVLEVVGFGAVANAAHVMGLVAGMFLGLVAAILQWVRR